MAQGLVGLWLPGVSPLDLTTGVVAARAGNGGTRVATKNGNVGQRFRRASSDGLNLGTAARYNMTNGSGLSIAVLYTPTTSSDGMLVARDDNSAGRGFTLSHNLLAAGDDFVVYNAGGVGIVALNHVTPLTTATERMLIGAWNNVGTGASVLTRDGVVVASSSPSIQANAVTTGATTIGYRTYSGFNNPIDADFTLVGLWNRSIYHLGGSARESTLHRDFVADPWQILTWRQSPSVFVLTPGGATQALAGTIGATSSISGTLSLTTALSGTIAGQSSLNGALGMTYGLAGTIGATSLLSGSLGMTYALSGTIGATSSLAGTLSLDGAVTDDPNKLTMTIRETGKTITIRERR